MALIQIKRSSVAGLVPLASELEAGELAINTADLELYAEDSAGAVHPLGRAAVPSVKPKTAHYICGMTINGTFVNQSLVANRAYWYPLVSGRTVEIDRASVYVSTGAASSFVRIGLYASDADGWPTGSPIFTSGDLSSASTGEKFEACSLTLRRGEQIWTVVHSSAAPALRSISRTYQVPIYVNPLNVSSSSSAYNTQTFALGLPAPTSLLFTTGNSPAVFLRST